MKDRAKTAADRENRETDCMCMQPILRKLSSICVATLSKDLVESVGIPLYMEPLTGQDSASGQKQF